MATSPQIDELLAIVPPPLAIEHPGEGGQERQQPGKIFRLLMGVPRTQREEDM